jgi:hypothetical protein
MNLVVLIMIDSNCYYQCQLHAEGGLCFLFLPYTAIVLTKLVLPPPLPLLPPPVSECARVFCNCLKAEDGWEFYARYTLFRGEEDAGLCIVRRVPGGSKLVAVHKGPGIFN